jgi:hypothetical protein
MLDGSRVRHRVAEINWDLDTLSKVTDIPSGTLRNATTDPKPRQPVSLKRAYRIARALSLELAEILASGGDEGVPSTPPAQPSRPNKPTKRKDADERKTGPKRTERGAA